ncbi:MAG TPA: hypothetical protein VGU61_01495 [Noviherbaspirillum sp.]|jgi:hypothetical protein|uniref:hypothetical protein n=1 Tax=Noviherbaspirillum sp. TaxID=1926288 RepID=UPI002DDD3240|nr:hypothetical protein [Noviherbaspirillum sp.]HEV2608912.1 hypothetical protein [Noviherbaspirillum sp.]
MAQSLSNSFVVRVQENPAVKPLPAWVPPAGYFADVPMLNNPADVRPAIYGASDTMNGPFIIWGGSAILRDYSDLGAQVYYSGGHESSGGESNVQMSLICDFSSLTWSVKNLPLSANISSSFNSAGLAPDSTPYNPHTYLGLQEMPAGWGGGAKGTLVSFFWAGSSYPNRINLLDVSKEINGYSQLPTSQPANSEPTRISFSSNGRASGGTYPITVMDESRQGWWAATNGPVDYTLFINRQGQITQFPALGGNTQDAALVLCKSLNLLVMINGGYANSSAPRRLYIRDLSTGTVTSSTTAGRIPNLGIGYDGSTVPNYHRAGSMGLQWVDELGCVVGLDESTSPPSVVKLSPPLNSPATSPWTWSTISLKHWVDGNPNGQSQLQSVRNSVWSKFRWVPSLRAFVYGTGKDRKPQVIRIA